MTIDPTVVVAVVAIINACAAAVALIITTWFAARKAGRADREHGPKGDL